MHPLEDNHSSSADVDKSLVSKMVLRVLLVEADDSTRRIIAALLRKCGYIVSAVSDGLKAWETLKARSHNVDLILTEVELPSISGYALLTLIMEHDACKNIPVIMISSQDSISVVLKCMLRGAADFLLKPVRRNELRNLWQHVWRRKTSNQQIAGNVLQKTTAAKLKVSTVKNETDNHQEDKDCSKSDAQSSSTTFYLEPSSADVPIMQAMFPMRYKSVSDISDEDGQEEEVNLIEQSIIPKNEIGGQQSKCGREVVSCIKACKSAESILAVDPSSSRIMNMSDISEGPSNGKNGNINDEIHSCTDELVGPSSAMDLISKFEHYPADISGCFSDNGAVNKLNVAPYLELSLRRSYPDSYQEEGMIEQHMLKHSDASAFSKYDNSKILQPTFQTMDRDCGYDAMQSSSQECLMTKVVSQCEHIEATPPNSQLGFIPLAGLSLDTMWHNHIPAMFNKPGFSPLCEPKSTGWCQQPSAPVSSSLHSTSEIHNSEHGWHRDETASSDDPYGQEKETNMGHAEGLGIDSPVPDPSATSSLCDGVAGKLNHSVCGSICSAVDSNSIPSAAVAKSTFSENVNQNHLHVQDGLVGIDSCRSTQREAALLKFRLKRKDRCFDKKVRYQSRKRIAEQRPREKGQFVRQVQAGPSHGDCG